jgi:hypothetical protein
VLLLDADHAARIDELQQVQELGEEGKAFFGSRFMLGASVSGKSVLRTIVSAVYRRYSRSLYRFATGKKAPNDLQCPWKLFRRSEVTGLSVKTWAGDFELAAHLAAEIVDIPVTFMHKVRGGKVRASTAVTMAIETFRLALKVRAERGVRAQEARGNSYVR